jgi:hypothetical protein
VVAVKDADSVRYARTTPGFAAELDDFASGFQKEIGSWEGLIARLVSS